MIYLACIAVALMFIAPLHPGLAIVLGVPVCVALFLFLVSESLRK